MPFAEPQRMPSRFGQLFAVALLAACGTREESSWDDPHKSDLGNDKLEAPLAPIHDISGYGPVYGELVLTKDIENCLLSPCPKLQTGDKLLSIRTLSFGGTAARVVLDPYSAWTMLLPETTVYNSTAFASHDKPRSPYKMAMESPPLKALSTAHINKLMKVSLTIDMCRSNVINPGGGWEEELFQKLRQWSPEQPGQRLHVGIAMTGRWANSNQENFKRLVTFCREFLECTWINHSYSHPLSGNSNSDYRFLTADGIDFQKEVLDLEQLLLSQDVVPSPLFRFPGLLYNDKLLQSLKSPLSMIPLDANAWLAKGEPITFGSVVLVHGNGNEPDGVRKLLEKVQNIGPENIEFVSPLVAIPGVKPRASEGKGRLESQPQ